MRRRGASLTDHHLAGKLDHEFPFIGFFHENDLGGFLFQPVVQTFDADRPPAADIIRPASPRLLKAILWSDK
jgi:hypothetical protein